MHKRLVTRYAMKSTDHGDDRGEPDRVDGRSFVHFQDGARGEPTRDGARAQDQQTAEARRRATSASIE